MSFEWRDYLHLARELTAGAQGSAGMDASLRSAISRAYYAVFCQARNHLRDKQQQSLPPGGQVHTYVRTQFQTSSQNARKAIGQRLDRLRIARNKADYDDEVSGLPALAQATLTWAEDVIQRLAGL